jgi:phage FluMu protein gp41
MQQQETQEALKMDLGRQIINGKSIRTAELEIDWNGEKKKVTMRRLTNGMRNDVNQAAIEVKLLGNITSAIVNSKVLQEQALLRSVIEAPFQLNIKEIQDLDIDTADQLWATYQELNEASGKKNQAAA